MESPSPIRLVFCITELDPGGAERALVQLVLHLDRNQWEPHVICLGPTGHFADVLQAANIPVTCLNARGSLSLPRVLRQLVRELRRINPALVQTFLFHANVLGRIAARLAGIPCVISGIRVAEHRSPWYGRIDRWTNFLVKTNVCVSRGVTSFSATQVGLDQEKLIVIPNAVEVDRFASAKPAQLQQFGIPDGSKVFISIGRLEHQKGIDVLLTAIEQLKPIPNELHFLIVGNGPGESALRAQATAKGIAEHVHFVGRRTDVPELLSASFGLILASRWEGMPNVVLEAMAAGKPVIATRVEGIEELVRDGVTGLTIPKEDPNKLVAAVRTMLEDPDFYTAAGVRAQDIVAQEFAPQAIADSYQNLYLRTLNKR